MGTNDSLSNYIFSVAGRTTKSISGYKSIVKGTIISQSYNNYKVQIAGGADEVTAQTLGSGSYKKDDSVYLLETAVSGGESNAISKYFIISLTEEADPMANVTLRDSFEPKGTEYTVDDNKTEIEDVSLINELKQYGAFKLSFNVTLPESTEIQDEYLLLKLMTDDDTLYDCKSSLGDWRGDIQARLMDVLQEQVYFLEGASINNINSIELMKSTDFVFSNITITPGVISHNSDDFTATLTCSQNDQGKDYVPLFADENYTLTLRTTINYKDKSFYATGINYYWQRYNEKTKQWDELNENSTIKYTIDANKSFAINYTQNDDNLMIISGEYITLNNNQIFSFSSILPYYNNQFRCVCYYGNLEIVTNTITIKNYNNFDISLKKYLKTDSTKKEITAYKNIFTSPDEIIELSVPATNEEFEKNIYHWQAYTPGGIEKDMTKYQTNIIMLSPEDELLKDTSELQIAVYNNNDLIMTDLIMIIKNFGLDGINGENGASITQAKITTSADGTIEQIIFIDSNNNTINANITVKGEDDDIKNPPYWIDFYANGGTFFDGSDFKSIATDINGILLGEEIEEVIGTKNPTRTGYFFQGWDPSINTTTGAENKFSWATSIYAIWEPDETKALETDDSFSAGSLINAGVVEGDTLVSSYLSDNKEIEVSFFKGDNTNNMFPILASNSRYFILRQGNEMHVHSDKFFNKIEFTFHDFEKHIPNYNDKQFNADEGVYDYDTYIWSSQSLTSNVVFTYYGPSGSIAIVKMTIGVQK